MKCMRAVVIWAALVPALFALGCAATEEKKDEATGTVTVSGTITYTGWSSGDFTIYVFVGPPGDSDPIHTGSVAGGTSVSYSASVAESSGAISVAAVNDLDGSGGPPGAGEGCGVGEATVGTSNVTVNITVTIGGCEGGNGGGGATQLTVDAAATAGTVLNSGSAAYYFSGSNGTNYTVTLTSAELTTGTPGNADLDVCSTSSCGWGDGANSGTGGLGSSQTPGEATETVTFTASASQSYYINVWGVSDTAYTIQVTSGGGLTGDTASVTVNGVATTYDEATSGGVFGFEPLIFGAYYPTSAYDVGNGCADFVINVISGISGTVQAPVIEKMLNITPCMATASTGTYNNINAAWTDNTNSVNLQISGNTPATGSASVIISTMGGETGMVSGSFNLSFTNADSANNGLPDPLVISGTFSVERECDEWTDGQCPSGGDAMLFTNNDGFAELTATPIWPIGIDGTASSIFNVNVPVDADTTDVNVILGHDVSTVFTIVGAGVVSVVPGSLQTAVVPVTLLSNLDPGTYYAWVIVCPTQGGCDTLGTGTWYMQSTTEAGAYVKIPLTGGNSGTPVETSTSLSYLTFP